MYSRCQCGTVLLVFKYKNTGWKDIPFTLKQKSGCLSFCKNFEMFFALQNSSGKSIILNVILFVFND